MLQQTWVESGPGPGCKSHRGLDACLLGLAGFIGVTTKRDITRCARVQTQTWTDIDMSTLSNYNTFAPAASWARLD